MAIHCVSCPNAEYENLRGYVLRGAAGNTAAVSGSRAQSRCGIARGSVRCCNPRGSVRREPPFKRMNWAWRPASRAPADSRPVGRKVAGQALVLTALCRSVRRSVVNHGRNPRARHASALRRRPCRCRNAHQASAKGLPRTHNDASHGTTTVPRRRPRLGSAQRKVYRASTYPRVAGCECHRATREQRPRGLDPTACNSALTPCTRGHSVVDNSGRFEHASTIN